MGVGLISGWTSPYLAKLTNQNSSSLIITEEEASWIASLINVTRPVGAIIATIIVSYIGAKKAVLLNAIPQALAWSCFLIKESVSWIYASRIISGIGLGMFYSSFPLYIGEISNPKIRGTLTAFIAQGLPIGVLLGNFIGAYTSMKIFATISLALALCFFFMFIMIPDSPHYLVKIKKFNEAEKSLKWYNRRDDVNDELESLKIFIGSKEKLPLKNLIIELFSEKNRKSIVTVNVVFIFMQLSGLYTVCFYIEIILTSLGVNIIKPSLLVIAVGFVGILTGWIAMYTNDKFGRKPMLAISSFGITINLFLIGINYHLLSFGFNSDKLQWIGIVAIFGYQIFMCIGIIPVPSCLMGEMFDPRLKGIGTCMANITSSFFAFITSKSYQPMVDLMSEQYVFYIYGLLMIVLFFYAVIYLPETKGKSLQEIQEMLGNYEKDNNKISKSKVNT